MLISLLFNAVHKQYMYDESCQVSTLFQLRIKIFYFLFKKELAIVNYGFISESVKAYSHLVDGLEKEALKSKIIIRSIDKAMRSNKLIQHSK